MRCFLFGSFLLGFLGAVSIAFANDPRGASVSPMEKAQKRRVYTYEAYDPSEGTKRRFDVEIVPTSPQELTKFSPEKMSDLFENRSTLFAEGSEPQNYFKLLKSTAYDFPKESAVFFAGVGGVLLGEMLLQYENNPMALAQQLESLKNPVGHVSFFMFMYANRISMNFWPRIIKNPALRPYLGMLVGMLTSDMTTEVLEPLRLCAKDLMKKINNKTAEGASIPCSKAYDHFVLRDKILDLTPSLTSMLLSSWLAGMIQQGVTQTLTSEALAQMSRQYLKWEVVNVGRLLIPGGGPTRVGSVVFNLLQISIFVGIDHQLNPLIRKKWGNLSQGLRMAGISREITDKLIDLKLNAWSDQYILSGSSSCSSANNDKKCGRGFLSELNEFSEKMLLWRQMNMEPTRLAHLAWSQKLSALSGTFDGAYFVYDHIINEIINSKQGRHSPLDEGDPYFGVRPLLPEGRGEFPASGYLDGSLQAQIFQRARLKEGAQKIHEVLAQYRNGGWRKSIKDLLGFSNSEARSLPPSLKRLEEIGELWLSETEMRRLLVLKKFRSDSKSISIEEGWTLKRALYFYNPIDVEHLLATPTNERTEYQKNLLNAASMYWFKKERVNMAKGTKLFAEFFEPILGFPKGYAKDIQEIYQKIEHEIGRPEPMVQVGKAYLRNFSLHPEFSKYFEVIDFPKNPGRYRLETVAEYFVHQMICGPEVEQGASLVEANWMSQDTMIPPRIRSMDHSMDQFCRYEPLGPNTAMYTDPIKVHSSTGSIHTYKGVIAYLKDNIRTEVLNPRELKNNLQPWWEKYVNPQIDGVMVHYAKDYQKVVDQFRELLERGADDSSNLGPVANSPLRAIHQEARLYLLILHEMLRDLGTLNGEQVNFWREVPAVRSPHLGNLKDYRGHRLPLVSLLLSGPLLSLTEYTQVFPNGEVKLNIGHPNLEFVLVQQYDQMLKQVLDSFFSKVSNLDSSRRNDAEVNILNLQSQFTHLQSLIESSLMEPMSDVQKAVVKRCLQGLGDLQRELESYSLIVSLLNRDVPGNMKAENCRARQNKAGQLSIQCSE